MTALDIWMRENTLAYIWLGSYAITFLILAVEIFMVRHKRKLTLQHVRMMQEPQEDEEEGRGVA